MPRLNRRALGLRLAIVAIGVLVGLALRWTIGPPKNDFLESTGEGTMRERAVETAPK